LLKNREIKIKAMWDAEVKVWIAVSDDVPGLVTEAKTSARLMRKLRILIPELLEANGQLHELEKGEIPFHLLSERSEIIRLADSPNG
jgi:hypothetical protein